MSSPFPIKIALISSDFRLVYLAQSTFHPPFYSLYHLSSPEHLTFPVHLILLSNTDASVSFSFPFSIPVLKINPRSFTSHQLKLLVDATLAKQTSSVPTSLFIGIDPGESIGLAAFMGDSLVDHRTVFQLHDLFIHLKQFFLLLDKVDQITIRVGKGGGFISQVIVNLCLQRFANSSVIELVNEFSTSHGTTRSQKHENAAQIIALREGVPITRPLPITFTPLDIKYLKKRAHQAGIAFSEHLLADLLSGKLPWTALL